MDILLVDDDPDIRMIAELALSRIGGFRVAVAESGVEALARLEREVPDLLMLDLMMPGIDGLGTLAALRRRPALATLPVIFMTARVQSENLDKFREAGATGCIQKPFDPLLLADEVKAILRDAGHRL